jgi:flagellar biosynthesis/type III secretory pathway protein FliH
MSRVIKAGPASAVVPAPVADARAQAAAILASAEAAREEARRAGFAAGRDEGLATTTALLAAARAAEAGRVAAAEAELRRLAVRIAEKILARELALGPDAVVDVVRAALAAAAERRQLVVRVHPDDVAAVEAARARLAAAHAPHAVLAVRADPQVGRGGCLVDTEVGTIDARLDVQLAAIEQALLGGPAEAPPR